MTIVLETKNMKVSACEALTRNSTSVHRGVGSARMGLRSRDLDKTFSNIEKWAKRVPLPRLRDSRALDRALLATNEVRVPTK